MDTNKAYRAGRSLLADHILGTRNDIRRYRATIATAQGQKAYHTQTWYEASLHAAEQNLRNLRYLSAELRGR